MKTIRLIVLAALLLPALVSQAQTKEETIEWLKDKLERYSNLNRDFDCCSNLKLLNVTECEITYSYSLSYLDGTKGEILVSFPTYRLVLTEEGQGMKFKAKSQIIRVTERGKITYTSEDVNVIIVNREENIYERIKKAIDYLGTFCTK